VIILKFLKRNFSFIKSGLFQQPLGGIIFEENFRLDRKNRSIA